jgi:hypothetical protein
MRGGMILWASSSRFFHLLVELVAGVIGVGNLIRQILAF